MDLTRTMLALQTSCLSSFVRLWQFCTVYSCKSLKRIFISFCVSINQELSQNLFKKIWDQQPVIKMTSDERGWVHLINELWSFGLIITELSISLKLRFWEKSKQTMKHVLCLFFSALSFYRDSKLRLAFSFAKRENPGRTLFSFFRDVSQSAQKSFGLGKLFVSELSKKLIRHWTW